jgi:CCR4-NOT transcriptional regulation complex NOT5 subunit
VGAGGLAVGSGISNANTSKQVDEAVKELTAQLGQVEATIKELDSRIERQQVTIANMIKEGGES